MNWTYLGGEVLILYGRRRLIDSWFLILDRMHPEQRLSLTLRPRPFLPRLNDSVRQQMTILILKCELWQQHLHYINFILLMIAD